MSNFPHEVVRITTIDPITGQEIPGESYYGVALVSDEGTFISRDAPSLEMLREMVGDLSDQAALERWGEMMADSYRGGGF